MKDQSVKNASTSRLEWLEERIVLTSSLSSIVEIGGTGTNDPAAMVVDLKGNYYIAGYFSGVTDFNPRRNRTYNIDGGSDSAFLARYGTAGGLDWVIPLHYDTSIPSDPFIESLAVDARGDIYMGGVFHGQPIHDRKTGFWSIAASEDAESQSTIWKFHRDGSFSFANQITGASDEGTNASHIAVDRFGSIYTTGDINTPTGNGQFTIEAFLTKWTAAGRAVWSQPVVNDAVDALTIDRHDNPWVTATRFGSQGERDTFLASKFNGRGRFLDGVPIGTSGTGNMGGSIAFDSEDNLIAAGGFSGTWDFDPGPGDMLLGPKRSSDGTPNIFISKITPQHKLVFAHAIGGNQQDSADGVWVDADGVIRIAGIFNGTVDFDPSRGGQTLLNTTGPNQSMQQDLFSASYDHAGRFLSADSLARPDTPKDAKTIVFDRNRLLLLATTASPDNDHRILLWDMETTA